MLGGVGRAILPFSRALVLILRAANAIIRERTQKAGISSAPTTADATLDEFIMGDEIMELEDGLHFLKDLKEPRPLSLIDGSGPWLPLINRWLVSVVGLELHHGCARRSVLPSIMSFSEGKEDAESSGMAKTRNVKVEVSSKPAAPRPAVGVEGDAPMADAHHSSAQPSQDVANGLN